jgi:hypothetical protein
MGEIKSSYELALERLKERGLEPDHEALTDEQKKDIGEIRKEFEAKMAELDIMMKSEIEKAQEPEDVDKVEAHFSDQRASLKQEMEKRLEAVRGGGAS